MSRVNMEDSLITDGHVRCVARVMGMNEREAWGSIGLVYRSTQQALAVTETIDRMTTLIVLDFDSETQARAMLGALVAAQLAVLDGNKITIRGNEKHVTRFAAWRANAAKGGKRSGEVRRGKSNDFVTDGFDLVKPREARLNTPSPSPSPSPSPKTRQRALRTPATQHPVIIEHRRLLRTLRNIDVPNEMQADRYVMSCAKVLQREWGDAWPQGLAFYVGLDDAWYGKESWPLSMAKNTIAKLTARWKATAGKSKTTQQLQAEAAEYDAMLERRRIEAESV